MMIVRSIANPRIAAALLVGDLVVLKTDTIYGILARADLPEAVEHLYKKRPRASEKSCIILVDDAAKIPGLTAKQQVEYLQLSATKPTTVVVPVPSDYLPHLTRTDQTLAFRAVSGKLGELIKQTGPLLAPSANPEGLPPAANIPEAVNYFGETVAIYVDGGAVHENTPSRIVSFQNGVLSIIRKS